MSSSHSRKDSGHTGKHTRKQPNNASNKSTVLTPKDANYRTSRSGQDEKTEQKKRRLDSEPPRSEASSLARVSTSTASRKASTSSTDYITIKVRTRNIYKAKLSDLMHHDEKRERDFLKFLSDDKRKRTPGLLSSFMAGGPSDVDIPAVEECDMDFMNFLNVHAFGNFARMYVDLFFGHKPRSGAVETLLDSASSALWVNRHAYLEALRKTKASMGKIIQNNHLKVTYSHGSIEGELYKDRVSFNNSSDYVEDQVFGVVDERRNPDAKRWREDDIEGILGIGPRALNRDVVEQLITKRKQDIPTIIDNMKDQKKITAKIIGMLFSLPDEGNRQPGDSDSVSSGSDAGTITGELFFGAAKHSAYNAGTLREVPATLKGVSQHFYGMDLKLTYNGETVMEDSPGIIDTGSVFIRLPGPVLDKYCEAVRRASGRKEPVVKYDEKRKCYHMAKKDFGLLKDLKFNFVKGTDAVFRFSPDAQVAPPSLSSQWNHPIDNDELVLVFRKSGQDSPEGHAFSLGMQWSKCKIF